MNVIGDKWLKYGIYVIKDTDKKEQRVRELRVLYKLTDKKESNKSALCLEYIWNEKRQGRKPAQVW